MLSSFVYIWAYVNIVFLFLHRRLFPCVAGYIDGQWVLDDLHSFWCNGEYCFNIEIFAWVYALWLGLEISESSVLGAWLPDNARAFERIWTLRVLIYLWFNPWQICDRMALFEGGTQRGGSGSLGGVPLKDVSCQHTLLFYLLCFLAAMIKAAFGTHILTLSRYSASIKKANQ